MKQIKSALLYSIIAFPITIWPMEPFLKRIKLESRQDEASPFEQFNQLPSDVQKEILLFAASPKAHIDYGQKKDETKKYVGEILHVKAFIKRLASYKAINKKINNLLTPKEIIESILGRDIKNDPAKQKILKKLFHEITTVRKEQGFELPDNVEFEIEGHPIPYEDLPLRPTPYKVFSDFQSSKHIDDYKRTTDIFSSSFQDCNLLNLLLKSGYVNNLDEPDKDGDIPLEMAVACNLAEIVQSLIDHGANPYQKMKNGKYKDRIILTIPNPLIKSILLKNKRIDLNQPSRFKIIPRPLLTFLDALRTEFGYDLPLCCICCVAPILFSCLLLKLWNNFTYEHF